MAQAKYCYWSAVDGDYCQMMSAVVRSARAVGVTEDFHVWSDQPVAGTVHHPIAKLHKAHYLFKFTFLRDAVRTLAYDYFVWLDADSWFVRQPGDLLRLMQSSPVHASLEADACAPAATRADWWGCPLTTYAQLMRESGVRSRSIFNVNAGFWIVQREAIDTFFSLCFEFWHFCRGRGYEFTEEAPLAYATHMLCGNAYAHTLESTADAWASDWTGCYRDRLPDGKAWIFSDYFTGREFQVNPAIVHAMRSKSVLMRAWPT